nr:hypothetical protein [Candidatus Kuenenia stuttgartiensis]
MPLVIEFCKAGFQVTGFDIDQEKVTLLSQGKSYIKHIDSSRITDAGSRFHSHHGFFDVVSYGLHHHMCSDASEQIP